GGQCRPGRPDPDRAGRRGRGPGSGRKREAMRQIFSSMRVENVERVAQLLRDEGIEVRISNGRSYKSGRNRTFSYRDAPSGRSQPTLWVVRSDDQVRARQLMRDLGLPTGPSTRPIADSYVSSANAPGLAPETPVRSPTHQRIMRYRRILLVVIAILAALVMVRSL